MVERLRKGRRDLHRQDQHAGVRAGLAHLQSGLWHHPQRLRPAQDRPAAAAAAPRCRWRCACCRWPTAPTMAAACAIRPAGTMYSAFAPAIGARSRRRARCLAAVHGRRRADGAQCHRPCDAAVGASRLRCARAAVAGRRRRRLSAPLGPQTSRASASPGSAISRAMRPASRACSRFAAAALQTFRSPWAASSRRRSRMFDLDAGMAGRDPPARLAEGGPLLAFYKTRPSARCSSPKRSTRSKPG